MKKEIKIIFMLRFVLLCFLVIFLIVFLTYTKTDCQDCSFEVEDKDGISAVDFYQMYYDRCLVQKTMSLIPTNVSQLFEN